MWDNVGIRFSIIYEEPRRQAKKCYKRVSCKNTLSKMFTLFHKDTGRSADQMDEVEEFAKGQKSGRSTFMDKRRTSTRGEEAKAGFARKLIFHLKHRGVESVAQV